MDNKIQFKSQALNINRKSYASEFISEDQD